MKQIKLLVLIAIMALITSCAETFKFPVSEVTPAADITVKLTKESKPNYSVTIEAKNLAAVERLEPSREIYVIWAISKTGVVRNVGHFTHENAETSTYKSSYPYEPTEIIITAESNEGNCLPEGVEISRVKLVK